MGLYEIFRKYANPDDVMSNPDDIISPIIKQV